MKYRISATNKQLENVGIDYNINGLAGILKQKFNTGYYCLTVKHNIGNFEVTNDFDIPNQYLRLFDFFDEKIEEIGVDVVVKNNIQSARLGGFGNSDLAVELFVQETEFAKVNPVIEEFRMSI